MSEFYVDVGVCAKDGSRVRTLRVKANTGAEYTRLPGGLLRELGWEPSTFGPRALGMAFRGVLRCGC